MLGRIFEDEAAAGVGITVNAEMAAGVIHADVFANHTTADLALAFVL